MKIVLYPRYLPSVEATTLLKTLGITQAIHTLPRDHPALIRVTELLWERAAPVPEPWDGCGYAYVVDVDSPECVVIGYHLDGPYDEEKEEVITPEDPRWLRNKPTHPLSEEQESQMQEALTKLTDKELSWESDYESEDDELPPAP